MLRSRYQFLPPTWRPCHAKQRRRAASNSSLPTANQLCCPPHHPTADRCHDLRSFPSLLRRVQEGQVMPWYSPWRRPKQTTGEAFLFPRIYCFHITKLELCLNTCATAGSSNRTPYSLLFHLVKVILSVEVPQNGLISYINLPLRLHPDQHVDIAMRKCNTTLGLLIHTHSKINIE